MKIKEKIVLLVDVIIQLLLLLLALAPVYDETRSLLMIDLFFYQLLSCLIHFLFSASLFRKIYNWWVLLVFICYAILTILRFAQVDYALAGMILLLYSLIPLMGYYFLLTFYEILKPTHRHEA